MRIMRLSRSTTMRSTAHARVAASIREPLWPMTMPISDRCTGNSHRRPASISAWIFARSASRRSFTASLAWIRTRWSSTASTSKAARSTSARTSPCKLTTFPGSGNVTAPTPIAALTIVSVPSGVRAH